MLTSAVDEYAPSQIELIRAYTSTKENDDHHWSISISKAVGYVEKATRFNLAA